MQNNISNLISEKLKQFRVNKGFSIEDVSSTLNIRKIYIKFLEGDSVDIENLPKVYVIGYLKMYAKYLELDISDHLYHSSINSTANHQKDIKFYFYKSMLLIIILLSFFIIYFIVHNYDTDLNSANLKSKQIIAFGFKAKNDTFIYLLDNKGSVKYKYFLSKNKEIILTDALNMHAVIDNPSNITMYVCGELYPKKLNKFINLNKIYKDQLKFSHNPT